MTTELLAPEKLLSTGEAARRLGVSPQWVRRLVETRELVPVLVTSLGNLYHREDIERVAAEREARRAAKAAGEN